MTPYFVHNEDGVISSVGVSLHPSSVAERTGPGETLRLGAADLRTQYYDVVNNVLRDKRRAAINHRVDGNVVVITGIPENAKVQFDGAVYEVLDGELEITMVYPGGYKISIHSAGYYDETLEVIV